ncbi:nicotinate-nucleotide--dimethylbenzimidazole phosphoribosyltransferase [Allopseudospirillum japonicum]|uniref:Nicotinate-nucleotide--dimethylbenzimidazole phosphoribosyltransferase n=1 Tax=Allopseudospirillum japonicum TaxID=64971 RepID=A0A1H6TV60_9GAMM|nr:nicotinate-nucleotide--dimethylbenzimidazole phosphoribosyltransferase [Allopseudospirillum japonicum]SEI83933.1 nicotinate-nucleotide--dimethylbenzimidazole phosphoribosyltransferase [Allopseudospirillum japonicum]
MQELILGGARSGKSRFAQQRAQASQWPVTYVATAQAQDEEMQARIAHHQAQRPPHWHLVECPLKLAAQLETLLKPQTCVLVDCLTLWLTNLLCIDEGIHLETELAALYRLSETLQTQNKGTLLWVSNETGMGVIPANALSRRFCDLSGWLHQYLGAHADRVWHLHAGWPQLIYEAPQIQPVSSLNASTSYQARCHWGQHTVNMPDQPIEQMKKTSTFNYTLAAFLPTSMQMPVAQPHAAMAEQAQAHQAQLTKPLGALGLLETAVIQLAGCQNRLFPQLDQVHILIFAADHGIAQEGVSAYPQSVTVEMIRNFSQGGAAINVLAQALDAEFQVINLGTATPIEALPHVLDHRICAGSANFLHQAAMTPANTLAALEIGYEYAQQAHAQGAQILILGEMGIANTSSASALAAFLLNRPLSELTGAGTGLDTVAQAHKARILQQALDLHLPHIGQDAWLALQRLGGLEIAGLVGACLSAAQQGLPLLLDGLMVTVAACIAERLQPGSQAWYFYAHQSAEPAHAALLAHLQAHPLLHLDLRLGEASGAALALPLLRQACLLHEHMATFAQAQVSQSK